MLLNCKEQLIALSLSGYTYSMQLHYLSYLIEEKIIEEKRTLSQIQQIIYSLKQRGLIAFKSDYSLTIHTDYLEQILELSAHTFMIGDPIYPSLWCQIPKPPLLIYYQGNLQLLKKNLISVVGTRKVSAYGEEMTYQIVKQLVENRFAVISGLANGVDKIAHISAMRTSNQSTIAVIPTALNQYYPYNNANLQDEIGDFHLLLSEFPPTSKIQKSHFIMRNRLVAGLSNAMIVIEAAKKSGSLITANYALQFNRELFVLPGRLTDPQSQGCNELIALGANMITDPNQLITQLKELVQTHHTVR